jgi:hypothetical protein
MIPQLDPKAINLFEQFTHTVDEMKKFPRGSANYVTLKTHAARLLDQLLDAVPDEFVELLYKRIQEARCP